MKYERASSELGRGFPKNVWLFTYEKIAHHLVTLIIWLKKTQDHPVHKGPYNKQLISVIGVTFDIFVHCDHIPSQNTTKFCKILTSNFQHQPLSSSPQPNFGCWDFSLLMQESVIVARLKCVWNACPDSCVCLFASYCRRDIARLFYNKELPV